VVIGYSEKKLSIQVFMPALILTIPKIFVHSLIFLLLVSFHNIVHISSFFNILIYMLIVFTCVITLFWIQKF